jgi:hypothetical protein
MNRDGEYFLKDMHRIRCLRENQNYAGTDKFERRGPRRRNGQPGGVSVESILNFHVQTDSP